jgi:hypothetical protein
VLERRVALIEIGPGVDNRDQRLADIIGRITHLVHPRPVTERAEIVGRFLSGHGMRSSERLHTNPHAPRRNAGSASRWWRSLTPFKADQPCRACRPFLCLPALGTPQTGACGDRLFRELTTLDRTNCPTRCGNRRARLSPPRFASMETATAKRGIRPRAGLAGLRALVLRAFTFAEGAPRKNCACKFDTLR